MFKYFPALLAVFFLTATADVGAQTPAPSPGAAPASQQTAAESIGSVANLQGRATVTRANATADLKLNDDIFKGDLVQTASNTSLGITLDDETTFTMGADARMSMDEFLYQKGGKNTAAYRVVRGTVAFVAGQVAKTGTMTIATPTATLGIRGTTGVIEVPQEAATAAQVAIKLYPDSNGAVGRIEVFAPGAGGVRLGTLTRAASGFGVGPAVGGRFAAVPLAISPQQAARDRGFVRQLFSHHAIGLRNTIQRRDLRQRALPPNLQRQNLQRPNLQRPDRLIPGRPQLQQPGVTPPGLPRSPALQQLPNLPGTPAPGVRPQQQQGPALRIPQNRLDDLRRQSR